jgi:tetratricopeptide (TPR) repeat protein
MHPILISCSIFLFSSSFVFGQGTVVIDKKNSTDEQQKIVEKYYTQGALNHHVYSREWQEELDKGLAEDSTIAYLWQQKAMPLFKQGKYELGMKYVDKAVVYDRKRWQEYRAFLKCIFTKAYSAAILDFEDCKKRFGNQYVMDHTYDFYIGLSFLQLNEFEKAEKTFESEIASTEREKGKDWVHHLDLFYYGISIYEQGKYHQAILIFEKALNKYPNFSDAQYYKAVCHHKLNEIETMNELLEKAKSNSLKGYTINEDNVIYVDYPYQVKWNK